MKGASPDNINFIDLNIAILPSEELSVKLIKWSGSISKRCKVDYSLNSVNYLPHLSLYSARYPLKNKKLVEDRVDTIVKNIHSFEITLCGFSFFSGYLFYNADKSGELSSLHETIVDTLNPLREGLISDAQKQLYGLSPMQKEAIENYGYVSVKELYMPHVSITHTGDVAQENLVKSIFPNERNSFLIKAIAISLAAEYGTFPTPIKTFFLI